jgi:hypothetical protein
LRSVAGSNRPIYAWLDRKPEIAKPNTEGGNGCDYMLDGTVSTTVIADASDDTGIVGMIFTKRVKDPSVIMMPQKGLPTGEY